MSSEKFKIFTDINKDIVDIRTKVFIEEQNVPKDLEIDYNEYDYIHCCLYVSEKLVAYLRYNINEHNVAHIGRVCVEKSYRKKNYGSKIMLFAENEIRNQNGKIIELGAQVHAKVFYSKLGYSEYGEEFFDAGILHIHMKKDL